MRQTHLAVALAAVLGTASFGAAAADNAELAELKAQLAALQAKVAELETRSDAQSDINIETRQNLDTLATSTPKVETKGGLKVTSADRKFEASLGGRIHFDAYAFDRDLAATTGTSEFRRARLQRFERLADAALWQRLVEPEQAGELGHRQRLAAGQQGGFDDASDQLRIHACPVEGGAASARGVVVGGRDVLEGSLCHRWRQPDSRSHRCRGGSERRILCLHRTRGR